MTHTQHIANIRATIEAIEGTLRILDRNSDHYSSSVFERKRRSLLDRRDLWEERLVQAELGTPKIYSRT